MKKIIITALSCAVTVFALLMIPQFVYDSVPTAKSVLVQKVEHTDVVELTGSIVKNTATNETNVLAYVNEKDISAVQEGQQAEITGDAFPNCVYTGEVSYIADYASTVQKGTAVRTVVEIRINITNPDDNLKAGYTANAKLKTSDTRVMTVVPYEAVNQDEIGEYVYVLQDNKAVRRYIITGNELSEGIEVTSGLFINDRVITVGEDYSDGEVIFVDE